MLGGMRFGLAAGLELLLSCQPSGCGLPVPAIVMITLFSECWLGIPAPGGPVLGAVSYGRVRPAAWWPGREQEKTASGEH